MKFADLMREIEAEALAEGPAAVAELETLRITFAEQAFAALVRNYLSRRIHDPTRRYYDVTYDIRRKFGTSKSTIERWSSGTTAPPPAMRKLVISWIETNP